MSDKRKTIINGSDLQEAQVTTYLAEHPDYFENHPDILEQMRLPHERGAAVSLVERQVSVLRERNMEMRARLNNMLDTARANDKLFEKTKRLVLRLLDAEDLQAVLDILNDSLNTDYEVEHFSLILLGNQQQIPATTAKVVGIDEAQSQIGTLLRSNRAICGILRQEELNFLFGEHAFQVGSVAAVPLHRGNTFGILAIGSSDPQYYRSSMGTLFLSYIAEILNRIIPRFL